VHTPSAHLNNTINSLNNYATFENFASMSQANGGGSSVKYNHRKNIQDTLSN